MFSSVFVGKDGCVFVFIYIVFKHKDEEMCDISQCQIEESHLFLTASCCLCRISCRGMESWRHILSPKLFLLQSHLVWVYEFVL